MRRNPSRPDSVFYEPHLRPDRPVAPSAEPSESIWHEPGRGGDPAAPDVLPYSRWLTRSRQQVSTFQSVCLYLLMVLAGGPLAVLSVLLTRGPGFGYLLVVITGPLIEEIGKVLFPLMIVERRPYLIRQSWHIPMCAVAAGLVFAVIENILYLRVYIPDPSPLVVVWRWTICVMLHTGCSLMAGMGVMRIHQQTMRTLQPPRLEIGAVWMVAAIVVHGVYNLIAIVIDPWL